jgi:hypothetical protein
MEELAGGADPVCSLGIAGNWRFVVGELFEFFRLFGFE